MKTWKLRHVIMMAITSLLLAFGGCSKGCSCGKRTGDQRLGPDGQPTPLSTLPGHKTTGDLNIHPFDRGLPGLYGPFEVSRPVQIQYRIINKIGQAINDAKMTIELVPPTGTPQKEACTVTFFKEGIYKAKCLFDRPGDWDVMAAAELGGTKSTLEYQVYVYPASSDAPPPAQEPEKVETAPQMKEKTEPDSETETEN